MAVYTAFLPDFEYYQSNVACQFACPVRTDGRAYVNAIAKGDDERAYLIARETNPFASTCGWVCGAPCEAACRRGKIDAPVAIRALKRYVNDKYGVYLGEAGEARTPPAWRPSCPMLPPSSLDEDDRSALCRIARACDSYTSSHLQQLPSDRKGNPIEHISQTATYQQQNQNHVTVGRDDLVVELSQVTRKAHGCNP